MHVQNSLTQVKTSDGCSDCFRRDAGLRRGSNPSLLLLIIAVSALAIELGRKPLEALLFAMTLCLVMHLPDYIQRKVEQ